MRAKMTKGEELLTPVELVKTQHPDYAQQTLHDREAQMNIRHITVAGGGDL